jgi:hypothetical protein
MISKKLQFGILAIVLVFALTFIGCGEKKGGKQPNTPSNPNTEKSIRITGISGKSGDAFIYLYSNYNFDTSDPIALGIGTVSGNSVTIPLMRYTASTSPWTGSGSYYIWFLFENEFDNNHLSYYYSNGKSPAEFGLNPDNFIFGELWAKLPKYTISSETSSIPLSQFIGVIPKP